MKSVLNVVKPAILFLLLVWSGPAYTRAEKLSVIIPGQNTEFNIDDDHHHVDLDIRSSGGVGLSLPLPPAPSTPTGPRLVLDAPPATIPTSPPGIRSGSIFGNNQVNLRSSRPTINALYEVPDAESEQQTIQGACQAQTVIVTSRATVVSTRLSISQVVVPTTVFQDRIVTSTDIRFQTNFQTSYITVQAPPQTRVETRTVTSQVVRSQTIISTSTRVDVRTQVITRPVTQEVTITSLRTQYISVPVTAFSTVVRTEVLTSRIAEPTYITVTSTETQYQPNTCSATGTSTSGGYTYPAPGGSGSGYGSSSYGGGSSGGYYGSTGGYQGHTGGYYLVGQQRGSGGYYGSSQRRPGKYSSRTRGIFGKWLK